MRVLELLGRAGLGGGARRPRRERNHGARHRQTLGHLVGVGLISPSARAEIGSSGIQLSALPFILGTARRSPGNGPPAAENRYSPLPVVSL